MNRRNYILTISLICLLGTLASAQEVPAPAAPAAPALNLSTIKLPKEFPKGYPIRFGVMQFTTSSELLLEFPGTSIGKMLPVANNRMMVIPTGASFLNAEIGNRGLQYFQVFPGKTGCGIEDFKELEQAVLAGQVTHVIQCVIGDVGYQEKAGEYYGVKVTRTNYSLDLNVTVYDLAQKRTVKTGTYTARIEERRPFNRNLFEHDIFQALLKIACRDAANGIAASASADKEGVEPEIQPVK